MIGSAQRGESGKRAVQTCNMQALMNSNNELALLLAPWLVRRNGEGTALMRAQCRELRDAIDAEIPRFMNEVNKAYAKAQHGMNTLEGGEAMALQRRGSVTNAADQYAATLEAKAAGERAERDVVAFRELVGPPLGFDVAQLMLNLLHDISYMMVAGDTRTVVFKVGEHSVHSYLAAVAGRCEVHSVKGRACFCAGGMTMSLCPDLEDHPGTRRLLFCAARCVDECCVRFIGHSSRPLHHAAGYSHSQRASRAAVKNEELCEAMLRHVGIMHPFSSTHIGTRVGGVVYDAMVESSHPSAATESGTDAEADAEHAAGMDSNTHAGFLGRIRKKMQRVTQFWMLDHPTIPHGTSFQSLLRIDDVHVRLATADVARQQELQRRVDEYTEQLSTDKLIEDFNTALTLRNEDGSQQTVDDVEDHFPGVRRAVDTLLGLNSQIKHKHALDAPSVRVLIEVIRTLNGPLSKIDGASAGRRASAHAYSYVGGISSADVPGLTAFDISVALNNDARTIPFTLKHWNDVVMAMHAFDAITWNHLFVSITDDDGHGDAPGSSAADSVRPPANAELEWVLVIGEGDDAVQVSAPLCVSSHYSEWYKWFKRCEIRLSQLDLVVEQGLPPVPSQYEIDKLSSPDREGLQSATVAINWITVMAQTMAYHVETRAMALYILTGSETREFIAAVATSGICLEALVAEATVQISEGQSE